MASTVLNDVCSTAFATPLKVVKSHRVIRQPARTDFNQALMWLIFALTPIFPIGHIQIRTVAKIERRAAFHRFDTVIAYFNTEV